MVEGNKTNKNGGGTSEKPAGKPAHQAESGFSQEEQNEEAAKAADQALKLQDKATELARAAAGAGDPEERQVWQTERMMQQV